MLTDNDSRHVTSWKGGSGSFSQQSPKIDLIIVWRIYSSAAPLSGFLFLNNLLKLLWQNIEWAIQNTVEEDSAAQAIQRYMNYAQIASIVPFTLLSVPNLIKEIREFWRRFLQSSTTQKTKDHSTMLAINKLLLTTSIYCIVFYVPSRIYKHLFKCI
jgi:hypothetical protein